MLAGFSPSLKSWKPDKIGLESNKKIVSDLRQNAAAKVIELCRYPPWRALKICSTTASSGQSGELAGEGHTFQLCASTYRQSPANDGFTYDFSTLGWRKGGTHSVETALQILNFGHFSGLAMCSMILSCDAGQWQQTEVPTEPWGYEGTQPILYRALCCQHVSVIVFCVFASHHVYKMLICVSCF